jgi:hypothetical protein
MTEGPAPRRPLPVPGLPMLLALTLVLVYLPSLGGGFLTLDDAWLVRDSPMPGWPAGHALRTIWSDFRVATRLVLGAEYLPVRDTATWVTARLFGRSPEALRVLNLAAYVGAVLCFRAAIRATLQDRATAELTVWLFALHPVHAESVAWIAGEKDVLALLFACAALAVHARRARGQVFLVPTLVALAALSKAVTVITPALLLVGDLLARRRPARATTVASATVAAFVLLVHLRVGATVSMVAAPHGGSRIGTFLTMGPVFLRYVALAVWPPLCSLFHEVPVRTTWTADAVLAYGLLLSWLVAGLAAALRGRPLLLAALGWWVIPLLPVSQVLFPLQNVMADRYLLLSVAAPCLLVAHCVALPRERAGALPWRHAVATALVVALGAATCARANLFGSEPDLYLDAYRKEPGHPGAAYQLGWLAEQRSNVAEAEEWYARATSALASTHDARRMAASNLAKLLARRGALADAESVLATARESFPGDPKLLGNLAEVVARRGRDTEARVLYEELVRRFPSYEIGRRRYEARYGRPSLPPGGPSRVAPLQPAP